MGYAFNTSGYLRATTVAGRAGDLYEHRRVWSDAHGPIPPGFHIHHVDEDRSHNALENLRLVSAAEHRRIHSNYQADGETKLCGCCGTVKPLSEFERRADADGVRWDCRDCRRQAKYARDRVRREMKRVARAALAAAMAGLKHCRACGTVKPIESFGARPGVADGVRSCCRDCERAAAREYMRARRAGGVR